MFKTKVAMALVLLLLVAAPILSACSSQVAAAPAGGGKNLNNTVKQTTIKATVAGDTVTIPVGDLDKYGNVNFRVNTASDYYMFMAYEYGDKIYVRADLCVPCGSESFTLKNGTLVCDSCGTIFNVQTGQGVKGVSSCMSYTKQPVTYLVTGGNVVMQWSDMAAAYQKTTTPSR